MTADPTTLTGPTRLDHPLDLTPTDLTPTDLTPTDLTPTDSTPTDSAPAGISATGIPTVGAPAAGDSPAGVSVAGVSPADLVDQVAAVQNGPGAHGLVRAFAANPAFRAAEWEELTTDDDPYRRPVRPADLGWLDYGNPLEPAQVLKLSGLLGHRMLRNIYDAGLLYLPPRPSAAATRDAADFYGPGNRLRGALAQPVLERHLFSFLAQERPAVPDGGVAGLLAALRDHAEELAARPGEAFTVLASTRDRREATTFALLQLSAYLPAARTAVARGALGEYDVALPGGRALMLADYGGWVDGAADWRALLAGAELTSTVGAYWQLYLNTALARGNHLHQLARAPQRYAELLGAFVHQRVHDAAVAGAWADAVEDGLGRRPALFIDSPAAPRARTPEALVELAGALLTPLAEQGFAGAVEAFHAGFADAAALARLHDRDLAAQLAWADAIAEHKAKAEAINDYLTNERIEVDLDTFVESCDETSTTHVHDEHRLVMIESGDMHFWNNVTHKISLSDGDKILIPKSRLHGSTVLSGSCTYHQPIIPDEMYQRF
jgi:hypothetical protein